MVECESQREKQSLRTFTDVMVDCDAKYQFGLLPRTIAMASVGDETMRHTRDVTHDPLHYLSIGFDTMHILDQYPSFKDVIDWNAYVAAVSFHDVWRSRLAPTPWNLWIGQYQEPQFAPEPAKRYMQAHGFPEEEIQKVSYLIKVHPYALDDSRRIQLEQNVDETLRTTGRFMYIVDSLDLFRPSRIDAMIAHISKSFGGISLAPFYKQFAQYYAANTNFSFDLGPEYPWIREEAARRREHALVYIRQLNK